MRLSRRSEYGLRALTDLVRHEGEGPIALATLASRNRLPAKFLEQIMATLKHGGHRPDHARGARRLRDRGGSGGDLDRAGHPPARRGAGAARLRVAALLRTVLVRRRGDLRAARHDARRARRDARDPRQRDAGGPRRATGAGLDRSARAPRRRSGRAAPLAVCRRAAPASDLMLDLRPCVRAPLFRMPMDGISAGRLRATPRSGRYAVHWHQENRWRLRTPEIKHQVHRVGDRGRAGRAFRPVPNARWTPAARSKRVKALPTPTPHK